MANENPRVEFLYTGRAESTKHKLGYTLERLDAGKRTKDERFFVFKRKPNLYRCGVYTVEVPPANAKDARNIFGTTFRWEREWDDEAEATRLDLKRRMVEKSYEAMRIAHKRSKTDLVRKACAPLSKLYRESSPFQRDALLVIVLNEIRAGAASTASLIDAARAEEEHEDDDAG